MSGASWLSLLESTLRVSTPLMLVALGGMFSERSGVVNIALEGLMLMGAFAGAAVASLTHTPELGLLAGLAGGALFSCLYAFLAVFMRTDQIVTGTAINMFAFGVSPLVCKWLFNSTSATPSLEVVGGPLTWTFVAITWGLVALAHVFVYRTPGGLFIRVGGEKPEALDAAGVSVRSVRVGGVILSGALAGLGGAFLSVVLASSFSRGMTAGRGFMALAAVIFGQWRPWPAAAACLLFGFSEALQIRLQGVSIFGGWVLPVQLIQIAPYLFTVLILAGFVGRVRAPKSLGRPF